MMSKEEIIIKEKYNVAIDEEIAERYLNVYNANHKDETFDGQIKIIFAFYHKELNRLLNFLNDRINGSKYYTANEGRQLLKYIDEIKSLQFACFKTKYDFIIDKNYYLYLKSLEKILGEHGTNLPDNLENIILKNYEPIFTLKKSDYGLLNPEDDIDKVLSLVSTRNAKFDEMASDEKLENLNIAIEYMLKENNKYIGFDYDKAFLGYITKDDIVNFRNNTHCFRHGSKEFIAKRKSFSEDSKRFLANYGLTICMAILSKK